jgi:hypothetical protein
MSKDKAVDKVKMDTYNIYGLTQEKKAQRVELGRWCKYEDVKQALTETRSQVIRDVKKFIEKWWRGQRDPDYGSETIDDGDIELLLSDLKSLEESA